jgi:hypothetical protein
MGQPLRITFNNSDHIFQIVNSTPITKSTDEIQILLEGKTVTLVKTNQWLQKETDETIDEKLIQAIGKAIALRYRI